MGVQTAGNFSRHIALDKWAEHFRRKGILHNADNVVGAQRDFQQEFQLLKPRYTVPSANGVNLTVRNFKENACVTQKRGGRVNHSYS